MKRIVLEISFGVMFCYPSLKTFQLKKKLHVERKKSTEDKGSFFDLNLLTLYCCLIKIFSKTFQVRKGQNISNPDK